MSSEIIILDKWENDFKKFIKKLDKQSTARLVRMFEILESRGRLLPMPYVKKINREIWELRIRGSIQLRVMYTIVNNKVYVLHWFIKKSNKLPKRDLDTAVKRLKEI